MSRERQVLCGIVLLALILRVAAAWTWSSKLDADTDGYLGIARMMVAGNGYANPVTGQPTAFRPPLLPLCLAGLLMIGGGAVAIAALQIVSGTLTVLLTGATAVRLNFRRPWLAPLLVAVDPLSLAYTPQVMTEVPAAFLLSVLMWMGSVWCGREADGRTVWFAAGLGGVFGAAALCRPTILALLPLVVIAIAVHVRAGRVARRAALRGATAVLLGAALVIAPWGIRNCVTLGTPVLTTTHGGYTLLLGNNPEFYDQVARRSWKTVWDSEPWQQRIRQEMEADGIDSGNERARDRWMYSRAIANIRSDPGGFVRACVVRIRRFWQLVPLVDRPHALVTWGVGGFHVLLFVGVIGCGLRSGRGSPILLLAWCLVLAFAGVHVLYWSNARMRAPLVAVLALLSTCGWTGFKTAASTSLTKSE